MQELGGKLGFIDDAARRMAGAVERLRGRSGKAESRLQGRATAIEAGLQARGERITSGLHQQLVAVPAGVETLAAHGTTPDLAAMQTALRSLVTYVRQNPVRAALLALGAGVVAATMLNEKAGQRDRRR